MTNATDAPQFTLAFRAWEIMAPAFGDSGLRGYGDTGTSEWAKHTGYYTGVNSWSDAEVLEWSGSLAVMWVPTQDPVGSLIRLQRVGGNVFRQINSDGTEGKHYAFNADPDGNIVRMRFNNNLLDKTDSRR